MPALYLATGKTAGEECSSTYEGRHITLEESYLTHPSHTDGFVDKGDPVVCGENIVGVAFNSAAAATDYIALDTEGIWFLTVYGLNYEGSSAVAVGDAIYINKTTCVLSKIDNKYTNQLFGYALGTVNSGSSGVCAVKVHWTPDDATERVGTSAVPMPLNIVGMYGYEKWYSTSITSGAFHGDYTRVDVTGAGTNTVLGGRSKVMLTVAGSGNAYGRHDTLETDTSAGAITGLGCGHRGNVVVANRAHTTGTYYGVLGEIFALGNTAALPTSNAALCANIQPGTAMDLVGNLMAFSATNGSTKPTYLHNPGNTFSGSIRILVNGAVKYLYFADSE
jgi:hypothetical protein